MSDMLPKDDPLWETKSVENIRERHEAETMAHTQSWATVYNDVQDMLEHYDALLLKLDGEKRRADTGWQLANEMKADRDALKSKLDDVLLLLRAFGSSMGEHYPKEPK